MNSTITLGQTDFSCDRSAATELEANGFGGVVPRAAFAKCWWSEDWTCSCRTIWIYMFLSRAWANLSGSLLRPSAG
jgi:hypothetical protein